MRLSSNLISILEPHLKELVKQHGEISDRLSVTEVMWHKLLIKLSFFINATLSCYSANYSMMLIFIEVKKFSETSIVHMTCMHV